MIAIVRERLTQPGYAARVRARRVSADGGAGAGARRDDGRARQRAAGGRRRAWCRRRSWCGGWRAAGSARTCGDQRRSVGAERDACTKCGGELVQRTDDNAQVVLRAAEGLRAADAAGARVLPGAADVPDGRTARRRRSRWRTDLDSRDRRRGRGGAPAVRPSAGERRGRSRRACDCLPLAGRDRQAAARQPAGGRRAGRAAGDGGAGRDDAGHRSRWPKRGCARRARSRRSRGITGTRRRSARR